MIWAFHHAPEMMTLVQRGQTIYQQHRWDNERARLIALVAELLGQPAGTAAQKS